MDAHLLAQNDALRGEARAILEERGLGALLSRYGRVAPTGSYALGLMTWRDLDLYLLAEDLALPAFFRLGGEIAALLGPVRMSYRNERLARTPGLPVGLYWGVHLRDGEEPGWKIDLWAVGAEEYGRLLGVRDGIARRLTPQSRLTILRLKDALCRLPEYRRLFHSTDIYRAVLESGVEDVAGFWRYLEDERARGSHAPA